MINKETIISVFDEKLTLLQWLKSVNKALDEAVLTNVEIQQVGNATFTFVFTFEDGSKVTSNRIIVNQGESVNGASIKNGHLYLSLTNGDELDAGNVKPVSSFSINASQHLIVNYGDGTSQDLGAIFSGNVNIDGTLTTTGQINAPVVNGTKVTGNEIVEKMTNYSFIAPSSTGFTIETIYAGVVKNGNKITFVVYNKYIRTQDVTPNNLNLGFFNVPNSILAKLYPTNIGGVEFLDVRKLQCFTAYTSAIEKYGYMTKSNIIGISFSYGTGTQFELNTPYYVRYEATFLLSDNMAV